VKAQKKAPALPESGTDVDAHILRLLGETSTTRGAEYAGLESREFAWKLYARFAFSRQDSLSCTLSSSRQK
jgi:hypothetical protein